MPTQKPNNSTHSTPIGKRTGVSVPTEKRGGTKNSGQYNPVPLKPSHKHPPKTASGK